MGVSCLKGINNLISNVLHNDKTYRKCLFIIVILSGITYLLMYTLLFLGIFPLIIWSGTLTIGVDFHVYMNSAIAFLNGEDPYRYGFKYFPLTILFYVPFTQLSFNHALFLMGLITFFLLIVTSNFTIRILQHYNVILSKFEKILLFFAIFLFYPVTSNVYGQANIVILCSLTTFYYFIVIKNGNIRASMSLWVATILKMFPLALIYIPILQRKWKFIIAYLSMLSASCIASVLLLGIPIHVRYIETFFEFQKIYPTHYYNASLSSIFLGLAEFFNTSESVQNTLGIAWLIIRIIFVLLILSYLYMLKVKKIIIFPSKDWEILTFSLILALVIAIPDFSWFYYAMFLVPSYILYIFVLRLNSFEKSLVAISLILFSFPMHAVYISKIIGGPLASLICTTGLGAYGSLVFLSLTVYKIVRIKKSVEVIK